MLIPKLKLHLEVVDGKETAGTKYYVWDTDANDYITTKSLTFFDTKEKCQEAIDWFNSLKVIKVS